MLGKLLKYDLKKTYKILVIFYMLAIFFGILTRIFLGIENSYNMNIIGQICNGTAISMMINILINNLMRLWHSFNNDFYKDESYLTHTLPIEKKTLYLSKVLTAVITLFTSIFTIALTIFIAYYSKENLELLKSLLLPLAELYDSTMITIILSFIFIIFLEIMNMLQSGYAGIIIGNRKNNHKIVNSVFFGFIIYIVTQIFTIIVVFIVALFNKDLMNLFYTVEALNVSTIKLCIYLAIIVYILNIIILYFVNSKLFSKGVNVD